MSKEMRPIWDPDRLARLAGEEELVPALYVLATPIGHLGDLTLRAIRLLAQADEIWCEDTRITRKLLAAAGLGASGRLHRFDAHSPPRTIARILDAVASGRRVVLASDAGTPLVSDPGAALIAEAHRRGLRVIPVPGASALTAALSVAGMPAPPVLFCGFPPSRKVERQAWLARLASIPATLVIYEAPHRLAAALADMLAAFGDREVVLARELTKRHEDIRRTSLRALADDLRDRPLKGEIVLVIAPPEKMASPEKEGGKGGSLSEDEVRRMLLAEARHHPPARAARIVARRTGCDRRRLYAMLLAAREEAARAAAGDDGTVGDDATAGDHDDARPRS